MRDVEDAWRDYCEALRFATSLRILAIPCHLLDCLLRSFTLRNFIEEGLHRTPGLQGENCEALRFATSLRNCEGLTKRTMVKQIAKLYASQLH